MSVFESLRPTPIASFSIVGLHLPTVDFAAAKVFYVDVLGAELRAETSAALTFRIGDFDVVAVPADGPLRPIEFEYPHCALTVTPDQFLGLKRRLDAYAVATNEPWTRAGKPYALMYFRDPSGNQFELFAPDGCPALDLRVGARAGGDYAIDFPALAYQRLSPPAPNAAPARARATGFNHLTVPVRDLAEGERFLVEALGGVVVHKAPSHVTTEIAGAQVGVAPQAGGFTPPGASAPAYAFRIDAAQLPELTARLTAFGSAVAAAPSHDGGVAYQFRDPSGNRFVVALT